VRSVVGSPTSLTASLTADAREFGPILIAHRIHAGATTLFPTQSTEGDSSWIFSRHPKSIVAKALLLYFQLDLKIYLTRALLS
jgi:hypothetical protein